MRTVPGPARSQKPGTRIVPAGEDDDHSSRFASDTAATPTAGRSSGPMKAWPVAASIDAVSGSIGWSGANGSTPWMSGKLLADQLVDRLLFLGVLVFLAFLAVLVVLAVLAFLADFDGRRVLGIPGRGARRPAAGVGNEVPLRTEYVAPPEVNWKKVPWYTVNGVTKVLLKPPFEFNIGF